MKPLILVTNDDGVLSPGLHAAAEAALQFGEVLVVAPRFQQTAMGRSFPRDGDTGRIESFSTALGKKTVTFYGVYGSPALAVAHAITEIAPRKPDLCISGINYGENLGRCLTCSGTIGAALEADSHSVPAIAFSRQIPIEQQRSQDYAHLNWDAEKEVVSHIVEAVLQGGMGKNVSIWNINIPTGVTTDTEIRLTTQSGENCHVFQPPPKRDWTEPYILKTKHQLSAEPDRSGDAWAVYVDQVISATPLTWNLFADAALFPIKTQLSGREV